MCIFVFVDIYISIVYMHMYMHMYTYMYMSAFLLVGLRLREQLGHQPVDGLHRLLTLAPALALVACHALWTYYTLAKKRERVRVRVTGNGVMMRESC